MTGPDPGLGLDLEIDPNQQRLLALGAVRGGRSLHREIRSQPLPAALRELDAFASGAPFVYGHNIWWHDLPWLQQQGGASTILGLPAVDTLALSAIAFAEHPYHALFKAYKPVRGSRNDPVGDAEAAGQLLQDAAARLRQLADADPRFGRLQHSLALLAAAAVSQQAEAGMARFLTAIAPPSTDSEADLLAFARGRACATAIQGLLPLHRQTAETQLLLWLAVGWLRVAGDAATISCSVPQPWLRAQFPALSRFLHTLRDQPCRAPGCEWCRNVHDARSQLRRWFGFDDFRPEPTLPDGTPAQRAIVEAGLRDEPMLALLPTGGGKSLCFQLPAIARYQRRGCLTIVISPLQALMHDQVDNFRRKTGTTCAVALTGRLTPPERRDALDAVRMGDAGVLYVSPEQLRNRSFRRTIELREIGAWVFDEAHCLSKWGHDFRPDYLYAARFIREHSEARRLPPPPIVCVTATAKPEVRDEILAHFRTELRQELRVFDGHAERPNLGLRVEAAAGPARLQRLAELVQAQLAAAPTGSCLVYTATRRHAEDCAAWLAHQGIPAEAFHAGLEDPRKKEVQERFLAGDTRVVCATNAFGMGIDKPDIRLVVHFEVAGSLEAYVQEVGRAGRDGRPAAAVLLYEPADVETQFRLAASSRLDLRDLRSILRRVHKLARRPRGVAASAEAPREAVCTTGEILRDNEVADRIDPGDRNAPTRVVTAIAWLERGKFLRREENATTLFQGAPKVRSMAEAEQRIAALDLPNRKAQAWLAILERLLAQGPDEGLSSDDFLGLGCVAEMVGQVGAAQEGRAILRTLLEMQQADLLTRGMHMTAWVRQGVKSPSAERLAAAVRLELALLGALREAAPDLDDEQGHPLDLRLLTQRLAGDDATVTVDRVRTILDITADRAAQATASAPGLHVKPIGQDRCRLRVQGDWDAIVATAGRRHALAEVCLTVMRASLPDGARGKELLAEFTLEQLQQEAGRDLRLRGRPSADPAAEIEYALLFLHRCGAAHLHKGLAVFRQAMILQVPATRERYGRDDFAPLAEHQEERTFQIHAMREFAERMLIDEPKGLRLLDDYFRHDRRTFAMRHFPGREAELARPTGPESWRSIVQDLSPAQRRIVEAPDHASMLVLAGPGSGKTRVVVHRCAFLLRVQRVPARSILLLCFNRSAALELRQRLRALVGEDALGVLVQTYHGMAARLVGRSPAALLERGRGRDEDVGRLFDGLMADALGQLETGAPGATSEEGEDHDDLRDRLLAGFRHILVDEYQDIDELQYRLVSAIAGRTLRDEDRRLTVLAVGDDDQNIYQWRGSRVEFLRRFEQDYGARAVPLVENYRSTAHIIAAANQFIARNRDRLKADAPIRIDDRRRADPPGGAFASLDREGQGRVRVLAVSAAAAEAATVLAELQRLRALRPGLALESCAVLARHRHSLDPVRGALADAGIPTRRRIDRSQSWSLFRLREVQEFLQAVAALSDPLVDGGTLREILGRLRAARAGEPNFALVEELLEGHLAEQGTGPTHRTLLRQYCGELLVERRRERVFGEGVMLGTVHGSKGAEFEHVIVLGSGFEPRRDAAMEEERRLYYVGMTRARQTLSLLRLPQGPAWLDDLAGPAIQRVDAPAAGTGRALSGRRFTLLSPEDVDLGFAGRRGHAAIAAAIDRVVTGSEIRLRERPEAIHLTDTAGHDLGRLSKKAAAVWLPRLASVRRVTVAAVVLRQRDDGDEAHAGGLRTDSWHVVLPEIEWSERGEPNASPIAP